MPDTGVKRTSRVVFYVSYDERAMLTAISNGESQATTMRQLIKAAYRERAKGARGEMARAED